VTGSAVPPAAPQPSVRTYPLGAEGAGPYGIAAGPDGAMWFAETHADRVGRITASGTIQEHALPSPSSEPHGITVGPDGALWAALETGALARLAS
jgi:virginiamycin B lyase